MTFDEAVTKAKQLAKKNEEVYFVVYESCDYHVANDFDLDTWFAGISDNNIRFCTADY
jgi:hypothetical protein